MRSLGKKIMMIDAIVREIKMPSNYHGFIKVDSDDIFNIYINEDMPDLMKKQTLKHEIEHAQNGDFESCLPVELLEAANNADPDFKKVCWIGRNLSSDIPRRVIRTMSAIADGGKIVSIPSKG
jgi:hypothetical protein